MSVKTFFGDNVEASDMVVDIFVGGSDWMNFWSDVVYRFLGMFR